MLIKYTLFLVFIFLIACSSQTATTPALSCSEGDALPINGVVVIEAERDSVPEGWVMSTQLSGFTGDEYITWEGENFFGTPGNGIIEYAFFIDTPGTYRFNWRSRIGKGTDITEHNDSWLIFPDSNNYFATQGLSSTLYPHGSGKKPNPNGAGSNGWFKIYMNTVESWHWDANTSDDDAHQIFVTFEKSGSYHFLISGRSNGHAIDRMILYREDINPLLAENLELVQTLCTVN